MLIKYRPVWLELGRCIHLHGVAGNPVGFHIASDTPYNSSEMTCSGELYCLTCVCLCVILCTASAIVTTASAITAAADGKDTESRNQITPETLTDNVYGLVTLIFGILLAVFVVIAIFVVICCWSTPSRGTTTAVAVQPIAAGWRRWHGPRRSRLARYLPRYNRRTFFSRNDVYGGF